MFVNVNFKSDFNQLEVYNEKKMLERFGDFDV